MFSAMADIFDTPQKAECWAEKYQKKRLDKLLEAEDSRALHAVNVLNNGTYTMAIGQGGATTSICSTTWVSNVPYKERRYYKSVGPGDGSVVPGSNPNPMREDQTSRVSTGT